MSVRARSSSTLILEKLKRLRVLHRDADSLIAYLPGFLEPTRQGRLLRQLSDQLPWRREVDDFGPQVYLQV